MKKGIEGVWLKNDIGKEALSKEVDIKKLDKPIIKEMFGNKNSDLWFKNRESNAVVDIKKVDKPIVKEIYNQKYERPSNFRAGVRDKVWEDAKDSHGRVRDAVTGRYMSKNQPWDMGHKPGYEFRKHKESAEKRGISREQFLDEYNNPEHYRPELLKSNRSHRGEDLTDSYFGD